MLPESLALKIFMMVFISGQNIFLDMTCILFKNHRTGGLAIKCSLTTKVGLFGARVKATRRKSMFDT